jgi:hypothetical protein
MEAFPSEHRSAAALAGKTVVRALAPRQWTERFSVQAAYPVLLERFAEKVAALRASLSIDPFMSVSIS